MSRTGCQSAGDGFSIDSNGAADDVALRSQQLVLWQLGRQEVTVDFSAERVVSDTGLLTIRKLDRELGVLAEAAARLSDPRSRMYVVHDVQELLVQQVYQFLGGYFDANDSNVLRDDPLFQTLADNSPSPAQPLASGS